MEAASFYGLVKRRGDKRYSGQQETASNKYYKYYEKHFYDFGFIAFVCKL
ncbi:hypothetical protein SAMN05443663_107104 [Flavobacterium defluvii]|uniref:Uncharacterized protein n=1 Tax=Flavobacterium defluvii TaxID=370979 RepID=A0A1M5SHX4_9FLAO|nr:hypothetical protein SAMN05443663_107104 [Flavobacterium defluvii]